jgi:formylglycine-generating enzyme required for sulfatase activity
MKLVMIPAGEFQMGMNFPERDNANRSVGREFDYIITFCDVSSLGRNTQPVHRVKLTKPFLMSQTEVTLGQFLKFYHDGYQGSLECEKDERGGWGYDAAEFSFQQRPRYRPWSWGFDGQTNDHPVVNVSWNDCVAFCKWLSRKEGKIYRLPTEAEWEYSCRGGTNTRFWHGDDAERLSASDNVGDASTEVIRKKRFEKEGAGYEPWPYYLKSSDGYAFSSPADALFLTNPFKLKGMHGNVSEWCNDWASDDYYSISPLLDPQGPPRSPRDARVVRGGNYSANGISSCDAAFGVEMGGQEFNAALGFRVVCELD